MEYTKMQEANRQSRPEGRAICDLTEIKVKDLLELLNKLDDFQTIAEDAADTLVPLIVQAAAEFYYLRHGGRRQWALEIAAAFVEHPAQEGIIGHTDAIAKDMASLAETMLARPGKYEMTPETRAQLKRIAESGQTSEPTQPTTTDLAPVEVERSARRARARLRASANDGQGVEASHA
jgi:hypothetical protein